MTSSKEKIAANRLNSRKSTGPKTAEGKATSRLNAMKHGLTSELVCLPGEDFAAADSRLRGLQAELDPRSHREAIMAKRACILSFRLDRCYDAEIARARDRAATAIADHDDRIMDEVRAIADKFHLDPATAVRKLKRTPQGVDFMVDQWQALKDALRQAGQLNILEIERGDQLMGRKHDATGSSRIRSLSGTSSTGFRSDRPEFDASRERLEEIRRESRAELDALIGEQIDGLEAHRLALPHAAFEQSRRSAPQRAAVDLSNQGMLLRRYETSAARELHGIFRYFDGDRPEGPPRTEEIDVTLDVHETPGDLASFGNPPEVGPEEATPEPEEGPETAPEVPNRPADLDLTPVEPAIRAVESPIRE